MIENYVSLGNKKIFYRQWGNNNYPALFLVHGNTLDSTIFIDFIDQNPELTQHFNVLALDLPGFGRSDRLEHYTVESFATTISSIIEILNLDSINLLGFSLGGHLGLQALKHTKNIKALALISTIPIKKPINFEKIFTEHLVNALLFKEKWEQNEIEQFAKALNLNSVTFDKMYKNCDPNTRTQLAIEISQGNFYDEWDILKSQESNVKLFIAENDVLLNLNSINELPIISKEIVRNSEHNLLQSKISQELISFYQSLK